MPETENKVAPETKKQTEGQVTRLNPIRVLKNLRSTGKAAILGGVLIAACGGAERNSNQTASPTIDGRSTASQSADSMPSQTAEIATPTTSPEDKGFSIVNLRSHISEISQGTQQEELLTLVGRYEKAISQTDKYIAAYEKRAQDGDTATLGQDSFFAFHVANFGE